MTAIEHNYAQIGAFIYTAYRHGGDVSAVYNWMADELGIVRPDPGVETVPRELYDAYFAKYAERDDFQASYERFIETIRAGKP